MSQGFESDQPLKVPKVGDIVSYKGTRYLTQYSGIKLEVIELKDGQYSCKIPDGNYTTWLDADELTIHKSG